MKRKKHVMYLNVAGSIDLSNFCLRVNQEMAWTTRRMANENS